MFPGPGGLTSDEDLVDVAPAPVLARLRAHDEGVVRRSEVLAGVLVLRRVTTSHTTAGEAHPQVEPRITNCETFLAARGARNDVLYLV